MQFDLGDVAWRARGCFWFGYWADSGQDDSPLWFSGSKPARLGASLTGCLPSTPSASLQSSTLCLWGLSFLLEFVEIIFSIRCFLILLHLLNLKLCHRRTRKKNVRLLPSYPAEDLWYPGRRSCYSLPVPSSFPVQFSSIFQSKKVFGTGSALPNRTSFLESRMLQAVGKCDLENPESNIIDLSSNIPI